MRHHLEIRLKIIDEDEEAWVAFPHHRWVFNKLDVAFRLGYHAGPACVPVEKDGMYIVRPIYNLYGMSVGAKKQWLRIQDAEDIKRHRFMPAGHFWCEFFEGTHYSIDYRWVEDGKGGIHSHWEPFCTTIGKNHPDQMWKFTHWQTIKNFPHLLPSWLDGFSDCGVINIEWKRNGSPDNHGGSALDNRIIEIHLRTGNDVVHEGPVGTEMVPVWQSDGTQFIKKYEAKGWVYHNNYINGEIYHADGQISDPRVGYLTRCKL